ncbi:MAG: hypothetical protein ACTHL3_02335 [Candidatus Nitrosocosmicus sp.]
MKYTTKSNMILVAAFVCLALSFAFTNIYYSSSLIANKTGEGKYPSKIMFKIDGIDYSVKEILIEIITKSGQNISKIVNPTSFLNPEDDENGMIQIPLQVQKGLLDMGIPYTACVKVIEDSDNFGNKISCQHLYLSYNNDQDEIDLTKSSSIAEYNHNNNTILNDNEESNTNSSGYAIIRLSL